MSKPKEFTPEQLELLARRKLDPADYEIVKDYAHSMILRNKATGQPRIVHKV